MKQSIERKKNFIKERLSNKILPIKIEELVKRTTKLQSIQQIKTISSPQNFNQDMSSSESSNIEM